MAKFKIVVSDLHLGAGSADQGNALEDFCRDREFAAFLRELSAESRRRGAEVELIVNGDAFEMLQVPHIHEFVPDRAYPAELYHSSAEPDSALKMALVVQGHPVFFDALRRFLDSGPPCRRVTFVKGNHDLDLYWPAVQVCIRQALDATEERSALLTFEPRRVCREGIYVEHGNQYAEVVSRVKDMESPLDPKRPGQLAIPFGSWFVMDVLNALERERNWMDGIKPITALVWYALAFDFPFAARAIAAFIRAVPGVLADRLLTAPDPRADLLRQLEDPARVEQIAARYRRTSAFRTWLDSEVATALDVPGEPASALAHPAGSRLGAVGRGDEERRQVHSSLYRAARRCAAEHRVNLVIFGHTHDPVVEPLAKGGLYINSGTWTWRADFGGAGKATWQELFEHPERFRDNHWLTYVRVDYDEAGEPSGRLLTYRPPAVRLSRLKRLWDQVRAALQEICRCLRRRP